MKYKTLVAAGMAVAVVVAVAPTANARAHKAKHHKARHAHSKAHTTPRYTGSQYCTVKNGSNWSLVGGAACNITPANASSHSVWEASYIIDFTAMTVTKVTGPDAATPDTSSAANFMTYLNAHFANPGWMYVGNATGGGKYTYQMVKCSSSKNGPAWAVQGTCAA